VAVFVFLGSFLPSSLSFVSLPPLLFGRLAQLQQAPRGAGGVRPALGLLAGLTPRAVRLSRGAEDAPPSTPRAPSSPRLPIPAVRRPPRPPSPPPLHGAPTGQPVVVARLPAAARVSRGARAATRSRQRPAGSCCRCCHCHHGRCRLGGGAATSWRRQRGGVER